MLADQHGNVIVVGTRDCSLQRRHQKLVEEAPAPFLTDEQRAQIHAVAKAICREAGYHGAGTVEYLVGDDGTISFLEVNTRLQVEHPVTEETAGIDLVREQFRIADGEPLRITDGPDAARALHRVPDQRRGPRSRLPAGPGHGHRAAAARPARAYASTPASSAGDVIGGNFDSLLAKVIVTGETRTEALERARRALDEMVVEGMATALPFHRLIVRDEAFTAEPFRVHTRWIETEWAGGVEPFDAGRGRRGGAAAGPRDRRRRGGRQAPRGDPARRRSADGAPARASRQADPPVRHEGRRRRRRPAATRSPRPMQGTIVKVAVADGDTVAEGDLVVVLEAMKMEQPLNAHKAGVVSGLNAAGRRRRDRRRGDLHDLLTARAHKRGHTSQTRASHLGQIADISPRSAGFGGGGGAARP